MYWGEGSEEEGGQRRRRVVLANFVEGVRVAWWVVRRCL